MTSAPYLITSRTRCITALGAIGHAFGGIMKFKRQQAVVAVPTRNTQGRAGNLHARTDHVAGIDGVAESHIGVTFRADITHRSEARKQREPCILRAD